MARKKAVTASLDHIVESLRPMAVPIIELVIDPANARKHPEKNLDALVQVASVRRADGRLRAMYLRTCSECGESGVVTRQYTKAPPTNA